MKTSAVRQPRPSGSGNPDKDLLYYKAKILTQAAGLNLVFIYKTT